MSGYADSAKDAAVKCIGCNAPVTRTIDGEYVCVECGESLISHGRLDRDQPRGTEIEPPPSRLDGGRPPRGSVAASADGPGRPSVSAEPWLAHRRRQGPVRPEPRRRTRSVDRQQPVTVDERSRPLGDPVVMVAIPAYNERATIASVVESAAEHADEVLVVDDGSDDDTGSLAAAAGASVIEHRRNFGYGAALKSIFREAARRGVDHLVVLDGDGQHDPANIPELVAAQRERGAEVVIGSRFVDGSETDPPLYRRVGLTVINVLTNLSMGVVRPRSYISDTQSGFRVYDAHSVDSLAAADEIGDRMDASLDILFHAHQRNFEIEEIPTTVEYAVENGSHRNPLFHGYQLVKNILRTVEQERPILSLGLPGFVLLIGGIAGTYLTFQEYFQIGRMPLELAFTATGFTLAGMFACFTAIVLHSLNTY
ncbi:MAG: glycosyltransferase family 2 protein [Haloarculaceae archaeon]